MSNCNEELTYRIGDSLYINVTNRCSSSCIFCVRTKMNGVEGHYLWLTHEPSVKELIDDIKKKEDEAGVDSFDEYVFCGYGEPLERFEIVKEVAQELKTRDCSIRLNSNGHGNLINGRNIVPELKGLIDVASISLNADEPGKYQEICRSRFGPDSFGAMLYFAEQCRLYLPKVVMTIVRMPGINIGSCQEIAEQIGAEFRVREMINE